LFYLFLAFSQIILQRNLSIGEEMDQDGDGMAGMAGMAGGEDEKYFVDLFIIYESVY
jgi:hypothetical protein